MAEVWFDGGMDNMQTLPPGAFADLISSAQPHAGYFGGTVDGGANVRWVGTEDGTPAYSNVVDRQPLNGRCRGARRAGSSIRRGTTLHAVRQRSLVLFAAALIPRPHARRAPGCVPPLGRPKQRAHDEPLARHERSRARRAPRDATSGRELGRVVLRSDNTLAATKPAAGGTISLGPLTAAADRVMLQEDQSEGERITA